MHAYIRFVSLYLDMHPHMYRRIICTVEQWGKFWSRLNLIARLSNADNLFPSLIVLWLMYGVDYVHVSFCAVRGPALRGFVYGRYALNDRSLFTIASSSAIHRKALTACINVIQFLHSAKCNNTSKIFYAGVIFFYTIQRAILVNFVCKTRKRIFTKLYENRCVRILHVILACYCICVQYFINFNAISWIWMCSNVQVRIYHRSFSVMQENKNNNIIL